MVYLSVMRRTLNDKEKEEEIKNPIEYYNRLWKCDDFKSDTKVISNQQIRKSTSSSSVSNRKSQSLSGEALKMEPVSVFNDTVKSKECFTHNNVDININNDKTESIRRSARKRKIKNNDFDVEFVYPNLINERDESNSDKDFEIKNIRNQDRKKSRKNQNKKHGDSESRGGYRKYRKRPKISSVGIMLDGYEKYLRYREGNNKSCRKNRLNKKLQQLEIQKELVSLENENVKLLSKVCFLESRIKKLGTALLKLKITDDFSSLQDNTAHSVNFERISKILEVNKLSENLDVSISVIKTIKEELNDESSVIEISNDGFSNDFLEKNKTNNYNVNDKVIVDNSKTNEPNESCNDTEIDFESCTKKSISVSNKYINEGVITEEKTNSKSEVIKALDNKSYDKDVISETKTQGKYVVKTGKKFYNNKKTKINKKNTNSKNKVIKNCWGTNFLEKYYEKNRDSIEEYGCVESFNKVTDTQDSRDNKINNVYSEQPYDEVQPSTTRDVNLNYNTVDTIKSSKSSDEKIKGFLFSEKSCSQSDNEESVCDGEAVKKCMSPDEKDNSVSLIANTNNCNSSSNIASSSETNESKSIFSSDDDDLSLVIASDQDYDSEESEPIDNDDDSDKLYLKTYDRLILDSLYLSAKEKVDAYEFIRDELRSEQFSYESNKWKNREEYRRKSNNISSRKCRLKRKLCVKIAEQQCMSLEIENLRLKREVSKLEIDIKKLNTFLLRVFKKN